MKYLKHLCILVTLSILMIISGCSNKEVNNDINKQSRILDNTMNEKAMSIIIGDYTLQDYKMMLDNLSIYQASEMYSIVDVADDKNSNKIYYIPLLFEATNLDNDMVSNFKISMCINETNFTNAIIEKNIQNIYVIKFEYNKDIHNIKLIIGLKDEFNSLYNITHEYIIKDTDNSLLNMASFGCLEHNKVTYIDDTTFILTNYTKVETEDSINNKPFKQYKLLINLEGWGAGYNSLSIPNTVIYDIIDNNGNKVNVDSLADIDYDNIEYDKVYMQTDLESGNSIVINLYCPIKGDKITDMEYARNIIQEFTLNNKIRFSIRDKELELKMDTVELSY